MVATLRHRNEIACLSPSPSPSPSRSQIRVISPTSELQVQVDGNWRIRALEKKAHSTDSIHDGGYSKHQMGACGYVVYGIKYDTNGPQYV